MPVYTGRRAAPRVSPERVKLFGCRHLNVNLSVLSGIVRAGQKHCRDIKCDKPVEGSILDNDVNFFFLTCLCRWNISTLSLRCLLFSR